MAFMTDEKKTSRTRMAAGLGRREFISLLSGAAAAWPAAARAQPRERMRRIGVLLPYAEGDLEGQADITGFREELPKFGWTDGRNIQIDYRWSDGDPARTKAYAVELVGLRPDVILAQSTLSLKEVWQVTRTIPILFLFVGDPVGQGFVASLAHPGGNITGFTAFEFAMSGKWLELLKEITPNVVRIAIIFNADAAPYAKNFVSTIVAVAPSFGVELIVTPVRDAADIERAIAGVAGGSNGGLIVIPDAFTISNRGVIISLTARYRLPAIYAYR
jgi:putative ABC transport system substrate-binding protein